MSTAAPLPNIPPADELAEVRDSIAALEAREAELRALMLSDPTARTGNHFLVEIVSVTQRRTDLKEMRIAYPAVVDEFTYPLPTEQVILKVITDDGEILPRQKRKRA